MFKKQREFISTFQIIFGFSEADGICLSHDVLRVKVQ